MLVVLPRAVEALLGTLREAGGQGYVVGGALRDLLRGHHPTDWDIACSLTPEELLNLFPHARLIGGVCGTVLVPGPADGLSFEITPCRAESSYSDGRHPDRVWFQPNIFTDLARRDFTINAMAFDGKVLVDPFGGQEDLARGIIRCVGQPGQRFREDSLRILRMLRFAAVLGFTIDPVTLRAAKRYMHAVNALTQERVRGEVNRILLSGRPDMLECLVEGGGLQRYYLTGSHSLDALCEVPAKPLTRWWAFATLCRADVSRVGQAFGFSARFTSELNELGVLYTEGPAHNAVEIKHKLRRTKLDYGLLGDAFEALDPDYYDEKPLYEALMQSGEPYRVADLAVNGRDLLALGIEGAACGHMLDSLLDAVIDSPRENRRETLLALARELEEKRGE